MEDVSNVPNVTDWLQGIGAIITAIISLFLLYQLHLAKEQLKVTASQFELAREQTRLADQWSKLNATFTYFTNDTFLTRKRALFEALDTLDIDLSELAEPISKDTLNLIYRNRTVYRELKDFMNLIEDYSAAVNVGALDMNCSYAIMSRFIIHYFKVFKPYIMLVRKGKNDGDEYFKQLEKLALEWEAKIEKEQDEINAIEV